MNTFGTLYRFEMKKIFTRKLVWAAIALNFILTALSILGDLWGNYYLNDVKYSTYYEMFLEDQAYQKALTGRKIDQTLLKEMKAGYDKVAAVTAQYGDVWTDEQRIAGQKVYDALAKPYKAIYEFVWEFTGMGAAELSIWHADEKDMYAKRSAMLEELWQDMRLTDGEKTFWRQKESEQERPVTYKYSYGYYRLYSTHTTVYFFLLLTIAVCLASVFADEHTRRTDQLILCSRKGKTSLYRAKLLAGVSFSVIVGAAVTAFAFLMTFAIYGADGFSMAFQSIFSRYSWQLSVGQAVLILYGEMLLTFVLFGLCVMVLSELLHSNIATLAVSSLLIIFGMTVELPEQYRLISRIWGSLPTAFCYVQNIFDLRLFHLFGRYFPSWQVMPALYVIAGAAMAAAGNRLYRRYQVSGR